MEGVTLIEGKVLLSIIQRLENIEQNQLAIMKQLQLLVPSINQGNVPDFISIADACKKYHNDQCHYLVADQHCRAVLCLF